MSVSRRWWFSFPYLIAISVLGYLIWAVSLGLWYPYLGLLFVTSDGIVEEIDPKGPAHNLIFVEDQIIDIDGQPYKLSGFAYATNSPGQISRIRVLRNGEIYTIPIQLAAPSLEELYTRVVPLIVAFTFWIVGVSIQALKPAKNVNNVFFQFFQVAAILLISGAASNNGPPWINLLLRFSLWVIGPLVVHLHLHFPHTVNFPGQKVFMLGYYLVSLVCGLLFAANTYGPSGMYLEALLSILMRISLTAGFLLVIGLLIYGYLKNPISGARSKVRIVVLGGAISFLPMITLVILPDILFNDLLIPYYYSLAFLGLLPLTYGYAILRYRLIEIDRHINRSATLVMVYSILAIFYFFLSYALDHWVLNDFLQMPVVNTILVLLLASIFVPLQRTVQRLVDVVFYGGWYEYRMAIAQITGGLEQITDLKILAETTSQRLVKILRIEAVCVFLADLNGNFSTFAVAPKPLPGDKTSYISSPLPRSSLSYLLGLGRVVERNALRNALNEVSLSPQELELLESEQNGLWVPIIGHGEMIGYVALGQKFGGDPFSEEDIDILLVVSRHLSPLIENIHLVTRLRDYATELERRVADRTIDLAHAKTRVEAILASVGEGVVVTNLDGQIERVNNAFLRQTNYREREIHGRKLWDCYQMEDVEDKLSDIRKSIEINQVWTGDLVGNRKDGSRFDVYITITPLLSENGSLGGYVVSQRDITQQKELDRLKDMFVSDVSHELRTPTTNIGLYLDLLENAAPEKQNHYLSVLKQQSQLLVRLVEDILDLSRLTTGKIKPKEYGYIDINTLAEQVIMSHRPLAISAGLQLHFDPSHDLPVIMGDTNQISRVISNLVTNAIHYTKQGIVTIRTYRSRHGVYLDVIDTGMGIDPEDQPHLFERFYRGRYVRQSNIPGTGLGLAIVKEILDRHSSQILIHSELGQGSTFTVCFPPVMDEVWAVNSY